MCFFGLAWVNTYDTDWVVGKTAKQIQVRYGKFDHYIAYPDTEMLKTAYYDLGTRNEGAGDYDIWIEIKFDEDGIAVSARKDHNGHGG